MFQDGFVETAFTYNRTPPVVLSTAQSKSFSLLMRSSIISSCSKLPIL